MPHGGARSLGLSHRRWVVAMASLVATLGLTGVSGPADRVDAPSQFSLSQSIESRPQPVLPSPAIADFDEPELVHDVPIPAHPLTMEPSALEAHVRLRMVTVDVTAYCPCKKCCGSHASGITSSGRPITYNDGKFVAADLRLFPYGTKVIIPGYNEDKPVEVIDRGGAIRGYHIDIFMQTHEEAVEWGKKRLQAILLDDNEPMLHR